MQPLNLDKFREALRAGNVEWRKHVLQRLAERSISQAAILDMLLTGEKIRDYPEDKPFASALFLGYDGARPLHVVGSLDVFEADYKTKRKP